MSAPSTAAPPGQERSTVPSGRAPAVRTPTARPGRGRRRWLGAAAVLAVVTAALGVWLAAGQVNTGGAALAGRFLSGALDPRLDVPFLETVARAALTTVAYAVLGTALALLIGLTLGPLLAQAGHQAGRRRAPRSARAGWLLGRAALTVPRGVHEVVWALLLLAILGLDPLVAILAIGVPYGAVTAKVVADLLDEAPRAPMEALLAAGASRPKALLSSLVPAVSGDVVAYGFYRLECSLRAAAILGIVGAGGLGFELALSFQALRYDEMWTLIGALVVLSAAAEAWSDGVRRRLGVRRPRSCLRATADGPTARAASPRPGRDPVLMGSAVVAAALAVVSAWWVGVDPSTLWTERARALAADVLGGFWPPDVTAAGGAELLGDAAATLAMSILGAGLAFVLALVLVVPAAATTHLRASATPRRGSAWTAAVQRAALRAPLLLLRAVPPPVWAFVLLLVVFPGILPGALALAAYNLGVLGRLLAEAVEELDQGPLRALEALGASRAQVVLHGVLPAALTRFAAHGLERWETAIRDTVVVGLVGAGGLGVLLDGQLARFAFDAVAVTLLVLLALTFLVDVAGARLRAALR